MTQEQQQLQMQMNPMTNTDAVKTVDRLLAHAYKKGAFNDLPPADVVNMTVAMSKLQATGQVADQQVAEAMQQAQDDADAAEAKADNKS